MFRALILTLFPEMFPGPLVHSLAGQALKKGLWSIETLNIRDFAEDKHRTVDDTPYGGGIGMVMRPDILGKALDHARARLPGARILYPTPRGTVLNQALMQGFAAENLIILCGRFEGIDQRVIDYYQMLEVSLGDFILSGGEIAALALLDACVRLLPGVIGKEEALAEESFNPDSGSNNFAGLLEYPHYTRPPFWQGLGVPEMLLSGHHEEIRRWRLSEAEAITRQRRPDLWARYAECRTRNEEKLSDRRKRP